MPYKDPEVRRAKSRAKYRLKMQDPSFVEAERTRNNARYHEKIRDPQAQEAWRRRTAAWHRRYYSTHPEWAKARQIKGAWRRANTLVGKLGTKIGKMRYRALQKAAKGYCSTSDLRERVAFYGARCWVSGCGKPFQEIDHVIPLSKGGTNWPANLRPICKSCNAKKGAIWPWPVRSNL